MQQKILIPLMAWLIGISISHAGEIQLHSGIEQARMIELYTSEGCSSCPPAEAFLNRFTHHPQLWSRYIPLAFHVDYWDYLGWQDPYADSAHSQRQRNYARALRMRTVYTPGLFANGREWRNWRWGREPFDDKEVGVLDVVVNGGQVKARFAPERRQSQRLQLHLAVLGMGLMSEIRTGENKGRTSRHEFVVLAHTAVNSRSQTWQVELPQASRKAARYALVAWVSRLDHPAPLQAVGGYIKESAVRPDGGS